MNEVAKLTPEDIEVIKTDRERAIALIKYYAIQYESKEHYYQLGSSCTMSATKTIDTIIGSAEHLNGSFLMPDEIHVEHLVNWLIKIRKLECNKSILTFYCANYIKRKINNLYRSINKREFSTTLTIMGNKEATKEFKRQCRKRQKQGVKIIRQ